MKKPTLIQRAALRLARWSGAVQTRLYASAKVGRMTWGFGSAGNSSADSELNAALDQLRARSRQLMRDSAYARRARTVIVNNVIGSGVGMQAQVLGVRGELNKRVNDDIERAYAEWSRADSCHTGGALHFSDLERAAFGEIVTAGEAFVRVHSSKFGESKVPLALELIEAERLINDSHATAIGIAPGKLRMGVEVDDFQRPVAYYFRRRHPGDRRWQGNPAEEVIRVPAAEVFHLKVTDRWPQTRGEPWLAAVATKLDDVTEYSRAEVEAARASSYYFATIETPEPSAFNDAPDPANQPTMTIESGLIQALAPGEKMSFHTPTRPNAALEAFMRAMLREIAAGVGVSYESISRDYSQSNYSSSRLALLDDRDTWRALQRWWIRSFREPLHRLWLQQAVFAGAVPAVPVGAYSLDRTRYEAVLFKPRGWSWVDPVKEVDAFVTAVKAGFTTVTDVIAQTAGGLDIEDVIATRARELEMFEEADINVETTVPDAPEPAADPAAGPPAKAEPDDPEDDTENEDEPAARLVSFGGRK